MDAINRYSNLEHPIAPTLLFEFHGDGEDHVARQAETVEALAMERGGRRFEWATRLEDRERLWQARHNAHYAGLALRPGCRSWATDVCVPISRLAECIAETRRDLDGSSLVAPMVGHVGDGNFHMLMLIDPNSPDDHAEAERLNERLVQRALAMGGTITGEHGIGMGKQKYMKAQHGAGALALMHAIKQAIDPENLMNPGKMLPPL